MLRRILLTSVVVTFLCGTASAQWGVGSGGTYNYAGSGGYGGFSGYHPPAILSYGSSYNSGATTSRPMWNRRMTFYRLSNRLHGDNSLHGDTSVYGGHSLHGDNSVRSENRVYGGSSSVYGNKSLYGILFGPVRFPYYNYSSSSAYSTSSFGPRRRIGSLGHYAYQSPGYRCGW